MATESRVTDAQQALFRKWAEESDFELDISDTPKRQFNVLAKLKGWEGGGEPWNSKWLECFDEVYVWRAGTAVALTPKIHPIDGEDTITRSASATPTPTDDGDSISEHHGSVWSKFKGFEPNPDATFAEEFWRLSKHQRWTPAERRLRRVELFDADFESHFGKDVGSLPDWQEFCRLCSVDPIPDTIAECIEALENVYVNIYDLLDHKRTEAPIVPFENLAKLAEYTLQGKTYPLDEAKADTFLPVFLKEIVPHRRRF